MRWQDTDQRISVSDDNRCASARCSGYSSTMYVCPETGEKSSHELEYVVFWFDSIKETLYILGIETD
jgi:hypothetical protein